MRTFRAIAGLSLVALSSRAVPTSAQSAVRQQVADWDPQAVLHAESYVRPPALLERIITTPRTDISFTTPSPDHRWFVRLTGADRGEISAYGKPHVNLGGLQIETRANRARALTTSTRRGIVLLDPATQATRVIETPKEASISSPSWSPDGAFLAYIANFEDASFLYVAEVATGRSTRISRTPLLATLTTTPEWSGDAVAAVFIPDERGPAPVFGTKGIASGPEVRLTESRALPQVVHPALLRTPFDKDQLRYYTTGQLALVDAHSHRLTRLGAPAMIRSVDASSDGKYLRVTRMVEPFSYVVPVTNFGTVTEIWDASGKVLATATQTPLREGERGSDVDVALSGSRSGQPATDTGKRNVQWAPSGSRLIYVQSMFGADTAPRRGASRGAQSSGATPPRPQPTSVRVMRWQPPFGANDTQLVYEGTGKLGFVAYGTDAQTVFVSDSNTVIVIPEAGRPHSLGREISLTSATSGAFPGAGPGARNNPDSSGTIGTLATRTVNGTQAVIVSTDRKSVFVRGTRSAGPRWDTQAPRPWLDRVDVESAKRVRVFESPADAFDDIVAPLNDDYSAYLYTHESPTTIPDVHLRDASANRSVQLTHNVDIAPEVSGEIRKRIVVTRPRDGRRFWTDITLPREWTPGTKLPGIIWFYPREFTSQLEYDRSRYTTNINRFPELTSSRPASSVKLWATQGYALIEPDIPIFGDSGKMNDNYTRDLRENLDAVVDAVVDAGFVDRTRMGIGGHSYGAFSTVNALTLTPYFKAGIAGDGMYNRSLTPFGFQSERRDFFNAQATYLDMSPFYRADKISGALLMYHGLEDQNVGTAPISSERMYLALQGLGKPAALYMYPYEDHSDATYQTDLDLWARWLAWFDIYLRNPSSSKSLVP